MPRSWWTPTTPMGWQWQWNGSASTIPLPRSYGSAASAGPMRWLFRPNLAMQSLTTRDPDEQQMEVALSALRAVLVLHEQS